MPTGLSGGVRQALAMYFHGLSEYHRKVKKIAAYFLITFLTLSVTAPLANAVVKPGTKCLKLGDKQDYQGKTYTCLKSKGKLVWDKGVVKPTSTTNPFTDDAAGEAAADKKAADKKAADEAAEKKLRDDKLASVCISDSNCPLGSKGPGGGRVFYDAGSKKSWGRYLEVVEDGWTINWDNGNKYAPVRTHWCETWESNQGKHSYLTSKVSNPALKATLGVEIGKGKANTDLMVAFCADKESAGAVARAHKGGGKSDWYLPSKNELIEFCKFLRKESTRVATTSKKDLGFSTWISSVYNTTPLFPIAKNPGWPALGLGVLWSSSEKNATEAWDYDFRASDDNEPLGKSNNRVVMPVRAFSF